MLKQDEPEVWEAVKKSAPPTYTATRLEARHPPGISDVIWTYHGDGPPSLTGFLELKDQEMEVRPQQGIFLRAMWKIGVPAAVLVRRRTDILLIPGGSIPLSNRLEPHMAVWTQPVGPINGSEFWAVVKETHKGTFL